MAIFCDFENIALGVRDFSDKPFSMKLVLERLLLKGNIVVKKAYADWDRYQSFKAPMHETAFELIEIPHIRQSGKNSADIRMVVDALDLCYTKSHVNTFVILSGDSDFSPLVSKLRENNKTVVGVGVKSLFVNDFDLLEERLLELQSKFHPDKFINSSEKEKTFSHNLSSKINDSYNLLLDNVLRINVILKSSGFKINEDNKSFEDKNVLIEIMDLQSECLLLDTTEQKVNMIKKIDDIIDSTIEEILKKFNLNQYMEVYKLNIKLSYLEKMKKNLKENK